MRKYHVDGTHANPGVVFVFGSNLSGIHGAGAARAAFRYYGAQWGNAVGLQGESYAIPTKDEQIETLPLNEVEQYVQEFVRFTKAHPKLEFFVTRVGCGLAGYKNEDIAPMFKDAVNCSFTEEWRPYLEDA